MSNKSSVHCCIGLGWWLVYSTTPGFDSQIYLVVIHFESHADVPLDLYGGVITRSALIHYIKAAK